MFELENYHDAGCLNKLADASGGHILDLYISDSMQDMLDIDIKSEVATVVGGASEFSNLINFDLPLLDFDPNNSFNEDSSHSDTSSGGNASSNGNGGKTNTKWSERSSLFSANSSFKNAHFGLGDFLESPIATAAGHNLNGFTISQCVNPNSVMPPSTGSGGTFNKVLKNYTRSNVGGLMGGGRRGGYNTNLNEISVNQTNSPCEKKSHLNFSPMRFSANGKQPQFAHVPHTNLAPTIKVEPELIVALQQQPQAKHQQTAEKVNMIRKNLANDMLMMNGTGVQKARSASPVVNTAASSNRDSGNRIEIAFGGLNGLSYSRASSQSPLTVGGGGGRDGRYAKSSVHMHQHSTRHVSGGSARNSATASSPSLYHNGGSGYHSSSSKVGKSKVKHTPNDFPKPAYSYSCLIAMALKNSRTGSLPVSEIYNFMCEHFPYFKTAPNGWKNSVRHNLSLNKCFDKIEKPATNGGQRKGCLWAMNPTKVLKMDEEVQKWSRKDPSAIRKAMVFPENLAALERGELKHGHYGNDEDEEEEEEEDNEDDGEGEDDVMVDDAYEDDGLNSGDAEENEGSELEEADEYERHVQRRGSLAGRGAQGHHVTVTAAGRRVYRRPVMLSEEFEMEDDLVVDDYGVDGRKRRRGSSSGSVQQHHQQQQQSLNQQRLYQSVVRPLLQHQQQQQSQRSRSRSNSPSVKMVLKQQQQRRLLLANGNSSPHQRSMINSNVQLLQLQQLRRAQGEALDTTTESEDQGEEEEEEEDDQYDEDIFPSGGMVPPSRIQMDVELNEQDMKGNHIQMATLIGDQADHLISTGNFDIDVADFYDEVEIGDIDTDRKDLISMVRSAEGGVFVPDGTIDLAQCDLEGEILSGMKKQRLDVNYSMQKLQTPPQGGSRRKMPLVNRVL